ncbi:MAG: hypothetical protein R2698_10420 [Microthrixaceae bacterium]
MATLEGVRRRLDEWRPRIRSTFVIYLTPRPSPIPPERIDERFTVVTVTDPADPLVAWACSSKRQRRIAREAMGTGRWQLTVALDPDGEPAGRLWQSSASERDLANGVPRMRLCDDEVLMFDLFIERRHRRSGLAFTLADHYFRLLDPRTTHVRFVYGFVDFENVASILWHHAAEFQIAQTVNLLEVGPFVKWKLPFSDVPRFGPMSRRGRHTDPDRDVFGPPLMP